MATAVLSSRERKRGSLVKKLGSVHDGSSTAAKRVYRDRVCGRQLIIWNLSLNLVSTPVSVTGPCFTVCISIGSRLDGCPGVIRGDWRAGNLSNQGFTVSRHSIARRSTLRRSPSAGIHSSRRFIDSRSSLCNSRRLTRIDSISRILWVTRRRYWLAVSVHLNCWATYIPISVHGIDSSRGWIDASWWSKARRAARRPVILVNVHSCRVTAWSSAIRVLSVYLGSIGLVRDYGLSVSVLVEVHPNMPVR